MKIIDHGAGAIHTPTDSANGYTGRITIERRDGRLILMPIWDFDLSLAKAFFPPDFGLYKGRQIDYRLMHPTDGYQVPLGREKPAHSNLFRVHAEKQWRELRQCTLHLDSFYAEIDGLIAEIAEALPRNFQKYPAMLQNGVTFQDKLAELKDHIAMRLSWIDDNIGSLASSASPPPPPAALQLEQNYPNPFQSDQNGCLFLGEKSG